MTSLNVLIIEDEEMLSELFAYALGDVGFVTEVVSDGRQAIERLKVGPIPDMIILDLHLPFVSGPELLQYIRNQERFNDTKVILATADGLLGDQLQERADLVLIKPIDIFQLQKLAQRFRPESKLTS